MAGGGGGIAVLTTKISKCKCSVCVQFVCAEISPRRPSSPYIARETVANIYRPKFLEHILPISFPFIVLL